MEKDRPGFQFRMEYGIIILLIILYLILYIFTNFSKINQKKEENQEPIYIVINAKHQFAYKNGKIVNSVDWNQIYGSKKFYSYNDSVYLGQYSLMKYETGLYLFDEHNNSVDYDGVLFTYSAPKKIDLVNTNFVSLDAEIKGVLSEVIRENNLVMPNNDELTFIQKINVDLDGNGAIETIYTASSFGSENNPQQFSFIYYKENGKLKKLLFNSNNDHDKMNYFSITQAMDLDNDNKKELIVQRLRYQTAAVEDYMIFKKSDKEYRVLASEL